MPSAKKDKPNSGPPPKTSPPPTVKTLNPVSNQNNTWTTLSRSGNKTTPATEWPPLPSHSKPKVGNNTDDVDFQTPTVPKENAEDISDAQSNYSACEKAASPELK